MQDTSDIASSFIVWGVIILIIIAIISKVYEKSRKKNQTHKYAPTLDEYDPTEIAELTNHFNTAHRQRAPNQLASLGVDARVKVATGEKFERAEIDVDYALRNLDIDNYVAFRDLIIPTGREMQLTQIDHVVVSIYGIFCIETKSHAGNIYGFLKSETWKQYLAHQIFPLYNPYKQNYGHIKAIEKLIGSNIRGPIHSYVVFPNAHKVVIDKEVLDMSIESVIQKINNHNHAIYDIATCERIAKSFAYAASKREELRGRHHDEVVRHVNKKVAKLTRYS